MSWINKDIYIAVLDDRVDTEKDSGHYGQRRQKPGSSGCSMVNRRHASSNLPYLKLIMDFNHMYKKNLHNI